MVEIFEGSLPVEAILARWYGASLGRNEGAFIPFVGTVRAEGGIEALSFDIYEPILARWYEAWQTKAAALGARLAMAHSRGDVPVHTSSYIAAVFSPKRRVALELIDAFVEDFKAQAPIWKYDIIDGKRIYARERSTALVGSGILGGTQ
ncbi:MAG: molybdenum cofactor biosynthesis protein MoaE [Sulfuricurvum sp. PC08-66]|nr:MAG: molybdenum cofactor biosynthesis protein MoaE [Sulfuricurvum sp. PC08-66]